jgi:hypothetical protein
MDTTIQSYLGLALASVIASAILFLPILITEDHFVGSNSDMSTSAYPAQDYYNSCFRNGVAPLWNPYSTVGLPVQTGLRAAYGPCSLLGLWLETGTQMKVTICFSAALACFGMSGLLVSSGISRFSAFLAGMTVGFGGTYMSNVFAGHVDILTTFGWTPLALWASVTCMRRGGCLWPVLTALVFTIQFTNGHYQASYITGWTCAIFTLLTSALGSAIAVPRISLSEPFLSKVSRRESSPSTNPFELANLLAPSVSHKERIDDVLGWLYRWSIIGLALTAFSCFQWLPALESLSYTNRASSNIAFLLEFNPPPISWLTVFFPTLFDYSSYVFSFSRWLTWEGQFYQGAVNLAFAFLAVLLSSRRKLLVPIILLTISVVLSLGDATPVFGLYYKLDPFARIFRVPARYMICGTLMIGWISALGLDRAFEMSRQTSKPNVAPRVILVLGSAYAALTLLFYYGRSNSDWFHWFIRACTSAEEYQKFLLNQQVESLAAIYVMMWMRISWTMFLTMSAAYVLFRFSTRTAAVLLIPLTFCDFGAFVGPQLACLPENFFWVPKGIVRYLRETPYWHQRVCVDSELHQANRFAAYGISDISGYEGFSTQIYQQAVQAQYHFTPDSSISVYEFFNKSKLFDLLSVRYYFSRRTHEQLIANDPGMKQLKFIGTRDDLNVFENPDATKRAYISHRVETPKKPAGLLQQALSDPQTPSSYVLMSEDQFSEFNAQHKLAPSQPLPDDDLVTKIDIESNIVTVRVNTKVGGLLVLTDIWWPGWQAAVDGKPARIWPVYGGLNRGVVCPAGSHEIIFAYLPTKLLLGIKISLATFILTVAYGILAPLIQMLLRAENVPNLPKSK